MNTSPASTATAGWHVRRLVSTLSFTDNGVWLVERWSIVAEATLDELMIEVNYDEAAPIEIDSYGAEVTSTPYPTTTGRRTIGLQLPAPVTAGDRHDFELALFEPRLNRIERHVYVPAVACRNLELRVHFQVSTAPRAVTRLAGDTCPTDPAEPEVILVNSCGEVATRFHDLHTGRPHGLSWKPPPQEGVSDHGLRATAPNSSTSRW